MPSLNDLALDIINKNGFLQYIKRHKIISEEDIKQIEEVVSKIKKEYNNEQILKLLEQESARA